MRTKIAQTLYEKSLATKRGDTIIEVMFAIAVFSLVAVITISMMNLGTANAEGSLELTTARHELNAQAEALRFVHSAYTAELALPECPSDADEGEKCQRYTALWDAITGRSRKAKADHQDDIIDITNTLNNNSYAKYSDFVGCNRAYAPTINGHSLLTENKAFILNTRDLSVSAADITAATAARALIPADAMNVSDNSDDTNQNIRFTPTSLGARIIYNNTASPIGTSDDGVTSRNVYNNVARAEGIWVVAIQGEGSPIPFYDFYIQTCWNAPNSLSPTILDTVIRLYNPGAKKLP